MASPPAPDFSDAFSELVELCDEFCHIPTGEFPFRHLKREDVWREYGICTKEYCEPSRESLVRGNFFAANYLREVRRKAKEREKAEGIPRHNIHARRLMELPVEVVLEVFGYLHPVDIFTLIRTTKALRSLLLSTGSAGIWYSVFARHRDVPPVPEGMSPPKWVTMLYGPPFCDSCKVYPALVDFTYNERICQECLYDRSFSPEELLRGLHSLFDAFMDAKVVKGTFKINSMFYPQLNDYIYFWEARYMKRDVEEFLHKLKLHQDEIRQGNSDGVLAMHRFLQSTSAKVRHDYNMLLPIYDWANKEWGKAVEWGREMTKPVQQSWGRRLVGLGYGAEDAYLYSSRIIQVLSTHHLFKGGKTGLELMIREEKVALWERNKMKYATLSTRLYEQALHKMPPSLWSTMPPKERILYMEPVRQHVNEVEWDPYQEQTCGIVNSFVHSWLASAETPVFWGLVAAGYDICENEVRAVISIASMSVFRNPSHPEEVLIGWESIAPHVRCILDNSPTWKPSCPDLSFCAEGNKIIGSLTKNIGKSSYDATVSDFDEANLVFMCGDCPLEYQHPRTSTYGSYFFSWRQAVVHGVLEEPGHRNFVQVVEETRKYLIGRQRAFPNPVDVAWACNHCPEHHGEPVKRASVVTHLNKWHRIRSPIGTDTLYVGSWTPPPPLFLARQPSECYICMFCPMGRYLKLYQTKSVIMHLASKHHITAPVEGTHYKHLDIPSPALGH
ncbi:hypothetical protein BJ165DRAFT_8475 [Panaeolus papilionaceus]|nr:hypothetical protein BJ165DRAFT_8475 [Panaeolus papilionaceus]